MNLLVNIQRTPERIVMTGPDLPGYQGALVFADNHFEVHEISRKGSPLFARTPLEKPADQYTDDDLRDIWQRMIWCLVQLR